jgi:murein tripeptide amidase MpaA
MLTDAGVEFEVFIEDVQDAMDRSYVPPTLKFTSVNDVEFDYGKYHDLGEIEDWMMTLKGDYPDLVQLETVGRSFKGRDITAIKFTGASSSSTNAKPGFWLDGGLHSREWISPATVIYMAHELLSKYGVDSETTLLLDSIQWYILPIFNPDGYAHTFDGDRMWRKTRSTHSSRFCVGVDPNRNWDKAWGEAGASTNPCADDYQGPSAFSEIEVKTVAEYIQSIDNLKGYINFHAYSELWMSPYGFTSDLPPTSDYDRQQQVSKDATEALQKVRGTSYDYGPISTTIYPASGSSADWIYSECGVLHSYGVELRDTGQHGFLLPENQIIPTGEETLAAVKVMAHAIAESN